MAITFKFSVLEMSVSPQRDNQDNVVRTVTWQCVAEKDGLTATAYGIAALQGAQKNFVPFEDLTESEVLQWLDDALSNDELREIYFDLERQINERQAPSVVVKPLPWISK
jgi:hypothetical protein